MDLCMLNKGSHLTDKTRLVHSVDSWKYHNNTSFLLPTNRLCVLCYSLIRIMLPSFWPKLLALPWRSQTPQNLSFYAAPRNISKISLLAFPGYVSGRLSSLPYHSGCIEASTKAGPFQDEAVQIDISENQNETFWQQLNCASNDELVSHKYAFSLDSPKEIAWRSRFNVSAWKDEEWGSQSIWISQPQPKESVFPCLSNSKVS